MLKNSTNQTVTAQLISSTDGSEVTSGTTTVYVLGDGGTQATGTGTITHEGHGLWSYIPTQAETNYSHVAYTFTNSSAITTSVQLYPITYADFQADTTSVTVGTNNDKTGYSISGTKTTLDALNDPSLASISDAVWDEARADHTSSGSFGEGVSSVQGNVTGSVDSVVNTVTVGVNNDKTGYSLTQTFPANFADLAITATDGYVTVGTNNDKSGYTISGTKTTLDSLNDVSLASISDAVWDEARSDHTSSGSFGEGVASVQGNVTGTVDTVVNTVTVGVNNDKSGYSISGTKTTLDALNDITASDVKTAMEATGSDLDYLMKALVNQMKIRYVTGSTGEDIGDTELFDDANTSLGIIDVAFSSDGTYKIRKRLVI